MKVVGDINSFVASVSTRKNFIIHNTRNSQICVKTENMNEILRLKF
jgi:hypothetical protein